MADEKQAPEEFKFVVRTPEGELKFHTFLEIEKAYLSELVGPDDEIREINSEKWRKASSYPRLKTARRHGDAVWGGTQMLWVILSLVIGTIALVCIRYGIKNGAMAYTIAGFLLAMGLGGLLMRVTMTAFKRTKPY
ncbi:MAG: hypothetical protein ACJ790_15950 [Myxococcaceae bacterium]